MDTSERDIHRIIASLVRKLINDVVRLAQHTITQHAVVTTSDDEDEVLSRFEKKQDDSSKGRMIRPFRVRRKHKRML